MVGESQRVAAVDPHLDQRQACRRDVVERRVDLLAAVGQREPGLHSVQARTVRPERFR
jgi:hypothetical protein